MSVLVGRSRRILQLCLFLSVFATYMGLLYEDGLEKSVDYLEAHSTWEPHQFDRAIDVWAKPYLFGEKNMRLVAVVLEKSGIETQGQDFSEMLDGFRKGIRPGRGIFEETYRLSDYLKEVQESLDLQTYIAIPDSAEFYNNQYQLFSNLSVFSPRIDAISLASPSSTTVRVDYLIDLDKEISQDALKGLLPKSIVKSEVRDSGKRIFIRLKIAGERKVFEHTLRTWMRENGPCGVPLDSVGNLDTAPLESILERSKTQTPTEALQSLRDFVALSKQSGSIFALPIDFFHHSWVLIVGILFLQSYLLVFVWPLRNVARESLLDSGWLPLMPGKFYRGILFFELLLPPLGCFLISNRLGDLSWISAIGSGLLSACFWVLMGSLAKITPNGQSILPPSKGSSRLVVWDLGGKNRYFKN